MRGLFQSERVNMLRMSEVNAVDHQAMPHMLTAAGVDWKGFTAQIAQDTDALRGGQDAVLLLDESAFAKKGEASAGVARQWNGRLGKVDNCQVGVFATLCRGDMASLVDARLYLPRPGAKTRRAATRRRFRKTSASIAARANWRWKR